MEYNMPAGATSADYESWSSSYSSRDICTEKGCANRQAVRKEGTGCASHELQWALESTDDDWIGGREVRERYIADMEEQAEWDEYAICPKQTIQSEGKDVKSGNGRDAA